MNDQAQHTSAGPGGEDERHARTRLLAEMRRIKDASGLSFGRLADRTHYSRSSWERFLNGKQLPTAVAVEQLAEVAQEDPEPLLSLLKRIGAAPAPQEPRGAARPPADPCAEPPPIEPHRRLRRLAVLGYVAAGALLGSVATGLVLTMSADTTAAPGIRTAAGQGADHGAPASSPTVKVDVGCRGDTCLRRDPQAMDCQWDAVTAHDTWLRGMHIQLRYSAACQAVWGRIENGTVGDTVRIKGRTGLELEARIRIDRDTYTRMLAVSADAPPRTVTVCGAIPSQQQLECSPHRAVQP
ncbi:helix-turn-helix domain-containing protein [Streptomyces sp. TRM49041]|uniref:helix-turn-helix domain-containing protein n=1 Tax=Streptomyces sp. TRM49041 TaxID=2603216 RepID=UPI0021CC854B|nr:DUF2690 domain-containing protein [Streptomyces sp. TRM49041]